MSVTLLAGAVIALIALVATALLLRTFFTTCLSFAQSFDRSDLSWRDYGPLQRLLDPADFEFLRKRGISEQKIRKLRRERRQIYRLCLRSLAGDFNHVQHALNLVLVQSETDRPDLVAILARQKLTFYRNLMMAEAALVIHACGIDRMPAMDLVQPFHALREQLQQLAPAQAFAGASA